MNVAAWSKVNLDYGRKLINSGLEGARSGEEAFLHGQPLNPFLTRSARHALAPAVVGACIGWASSCPRNQHRRARRALVFSAMGAAIGFLAGLAWQSRPLGESMASGALRKMGRVCDEHWLERHPIDYA